MRRKWQDLWPPAVARHFVAVVTVPRPPGSPTRLLALAGCSGTRKAARRQLDRAGTIDRSFACAFTTVALPDADVDVLTQQVAYLNRWMAERIAQHTAQSVERVEADADEGRWFTAQEAKDCGMVDPVVEDSDPARILAQLAPPRVWPRTTFRGLTKCIRFNLACADICSASIDRTTPVAAFIARFDA